VTLTLILPAAGTVTAVVIDDNADFVHFCQRCVRGTRYRIAEPKERSLDHIKAAAPDVVLLDIILPDRDGWDLLGALQRDPTTASIPVIICSIVHEEELASLMGAVEYLPKPIKCLDLLAMLDQVSGAA
jgi:CheY-like chemotaxis protein